MGHLAFDVSYIYTHTNTNTWTHMTIINNNGYKVDLFVYIHLFIYNLTPGIKSIRWSGHFGDNSFMYTICEGHMTLCLPACGAIFDLISLSLISQLNCFYISLLRFSQILQTLRSKYYFSLLEEYMHDSIYSDKPGAWVDVFSPSSCLLWVYTAQRPWVNNLPRYSSSTLRFKISVWIKPKLLGA